ncbi:unnamed protein product [Ectocarpus sp. 4 AP-2014]
MTLTHAVSAEDVTWVLTVPVCCSEPAKHFMREAATKAGFIKGERRRGPRSVHGANRRLPGPWK